MKSNPECLQNLRFLFNLLRYKVKRRRFPAHVAIGVTARCNLNCSYCYARDTINKNAEMDTEMMFSLFDELYDRGTRLICFTGGEPLMRGDLKRLIDYVVLKKGMKCSISTNGLLLEEKIKALENISSINISLDGPEEQHDRNRGRKTHEKVIKAIDFAVSKNIPVSTCTVLSKANMDCVNYIVKLAKEKRILCFFHILYGRLNPDENRGLDQMNLEETKKIMQKIIDYKNAGYPVYYSNRTYAYLRDWPYEDPSRILRKGDSAESEGFKLIPCLAGDCFCFIDTNGKVYPCATLSGQVEALNLVEVGFEAAWNFLPGARCKACAFFFQNELNLLLSLDSSIWLNFVRTTKILG
jgi:MoaA/NifB/PqqE/SkfB family radical SAM enzyme